MRKGKAKKLIELLNQEKITEQVLLTKKHKKLYKNLKNYIQCKQKIAQFDTTESN